MIPPGSRITVVCWFAYGEYDDVPPRPVARSARLPSTLATLPAGSAGAANWFEMNFYLSGPRYDGVLPPCDAPEALQRISSRFNHKENQFWNSDLAILGFDRIRETAFRHMGAQHHTAPVLQRAWSRSRTAASTPSIIRSPRIPA